MAKLPDFITAENELDGQEHVYIAQGGKTRKTLLQKIKEFVIGTTTMGTTATDITGAIAEHTSQMNDIVNNGFNGIGKALSGLTDMNTFTTEGVFCGIISLSTAILNMPLYGIDGSLRVKIENTYDEPTKLIMTQKITYQDGVYSKRIFVRVRPNSTTWSAWIELLNSSRVVNNFTTTNDGFIADARALKTLYDLFNKDIFTTIVASVSGLNYYDYTIPNGTIPTSPLIIACLGDSSSNYYVMYTKRMSDTVIRIGFNASFTGTLRINLFYRLA